VEQQLNVTSSFCQKADSCLGSVSSGFLLQRPTVPEFRVGFGFGCVQLKLEKLTHTVVISSLYGGWPSQIIRVVNKVIVGAHLLLTEINQTYLL
jgi:hypothetical protein